MFLNKVFQTNLKKFPGTMPVSLERSHLRELFGIHPDTLREYALALKADGVRYLIVFLCVDSEFLCARVDRRFQIHILSATQLIHKDAYEGTVLDVEAVPVSDTQQLLLVFDLIAVHGNVTTKMFYNDRMEIASIFMGKTGLPLLDIIDRLFPDEYPSNHPDRLMALTPNLQIKVKKIFRTQFIRRVVDSPLFKNDGYVWTLVRTAYSMFRTNNMASVKWKRYHTLDLFVTHAGPTQDRQSIEWPPLDGIPDRYRPRNGKYLLFTEHNNVRVLLATGNCDQDITNKAVHECQWMDDTGWTILQTRDDKTTPNMLRTTTGTIRSVNENITLEELHKCVKIPNKNG